MIRLSFKYGNGPWASVDIAANKVRHWEIARAIFESFGAETITSYINSGDAS